MRSIGIMAQLVARILRMDEVASSILADSIFFDGARVFGANLQHIVIRRPFFVFL